MLDNFKSYAMGEYFGQKRDLPRPWLIYPKYLGGQYETITQVLTQDRLIFDHSFSEKQEIDEIWFDFLRHIWIVMWKGV